MLHVNCRVSWLVLLGGFCFVLSAGCCSVEYLFALSVDGFICSVLPVCCHLFACSVVSLLLCS